MPRCRRPWAKLPRDSARERLEQKEGQTDRWPGRMIGSDTERDALTQAEIQRWRESRETDRNRHGATGTET